MRSVFSTLGASFLTVLIYGFVFGGLGIFITSKIKRKSPSEIISSTTERIYNKGSKGRDDYEDDYDDEDDDDDDGDRRIRDKVEYEGKYKYIALIVFLILGLITATWLTLIILILYVFYILRKRFTALDDTIKESYRDKINNKVSQLLYIGALTKHTCSSIKNNEPLDLEYFQLEYTKNTPPIDLFARDRAKELKFQKELNEKYRNSGTEVATGSGLFENLDISPINYNIGSQSQDLGTDAVNFSDLDIGILNAPSEQSDDLQLLLDELETIKANLNDLTELKDVVSFIKKYNDKKLKNIYEGTELRQIFKTARKARDIVNKNIQENKDFVTEIFNHFKEVKPKLSRSEQLTFESEYKQFQQDYKESLSRNHIYMVNCLNDIMGQCKFQDVD